MKNADLYKSVLNKIMTTLEECMKYNFATSLSLASCSLMLKSFLSQENKK